MDQTLDEIYNKSLKNEDSKINTKGGKRKTHRKNIKNINTTDGKKSKRKARKTRK